jgi:hypothetical protein
METLVRSGWDENGRLPSSRSRNLHPHSVRRIGWEALSEVKHKLRQFALLISSRGSFRIDLKKVDRKEDDRKKDDRKEDE